MKTKSFLFFFPLVVFSFFSCDVMKKRYSSGFYFSGKNTLPTRNVKEIVQSKWTPAVNQTVQLNNSKFSKTENDKSESTVVSFSKKRNEFSSKKQESILLNSCERIDSVSSSSAVEKKNFSTKSNNSNTRFQDLRGQTHFFLSKKTSLSKTKNLILKKNSGPDDAFSVIGSVLLVILAIYLIVAIVVGVIVLWALF